MFLSLIVSLILVKYNFKKTIPLFSLILLGVVSALIQKNVPSLIIVPSVAVFVELIMYFTIENPDIKLMNELVVAKDIAEKSRNETINTLNSITYKLNEEKNKLNNINIDKESKKLQIFYNNLLNEINDLIELGKINSSSYKIEEELYDLEEILDKLNDLLGINDALVRLPFGTYNNTVLETVNYPMINWTNGLDTLDWSGKTASEIQETVMNHLGDGSIVLMHEGFEPTIQALKNLLPLLYERGYQVVTINEYAKVRGISLKRHQVYTTLAED